MGVFNFMETSFIISLGITFVLILLLIYHFKQRLTLTESKQETMFEIINNLAQELNNVKGHVNQLFSRPSTPYPFNHIGSDVQFTHEDVGENEPEEESDDEDEDEDERIIVSDDDEDDDISVEELSDEEDDDDEDEDEDDEDNKNDNTLMEEIDVSISENVELKEESESVKETPNFSKMNLGSLKAYIVEKGLVEDASKMKKAQILTLIQEQQPTI